MKKLKTAVAVVAIFLGITSFSSNASEQIIRAIRASSPAFPFESHGDLWLSTWADNDDVFVSWGDGFGPTYDETTQFSHHGLAKLSGTLPDLKIVVVRRFMPLSDDAHNSKPTSLLYYNSRLYVAVHSPLLLPEIGFIAYSDDGGTTFKYDLDAARTRKRNANFICLIFINMGKGYSLNRDGYVYAFGVPGEINISGKVYLARMPKDEILNEAAWTYFVGTDEAGSPKWSDDSSEAAHILALSSNKYSSLFPDMLFSAAYHPGIERFLVMTASTAEGKLFEAPAPWGPWKQAGTWFKGTSSEWYSGYMPGIITKDMGPDYFYFAIGGRTDLDPRPGDKQYCFRLGKLEMRLSEHVNTDKNQH